MKILVTGGTGAVGSEVVAEIHRRWSDAELVLVSRRPREIAGCRSVVADLTTDLAANMELQDAVGWASHVIHIAADVRWNQTRSQACASNIEPTRALLNLTRVHSSRLCRFIFISTAFVDTPKPAFRFADSFEEAGRLFNNNYEWSKWRAEECVRVAGLPWVIVRPSLVTGHSRTGQAGRYNGFFDLLKIYGRGLLPFVVGDLRAPIDMAPSDVVADAICASLTNAHYVGKTVWVASGPASDTLEVILDLAFEGVKTARCNAGLPPIGRPPIIPYERYLRLHKPLMADLLRGPSQRLLKHVEAFMPYLSMPHAFDIPANDVLVRAPPPQTYLTKCIEVWCAQYRTMVSQAPFKWGSSQGDAPEASLA